jgi:membrane-associated phospholipid phosphatase
VQWLITNIVHVSSVGVGVGVAGSFAGLGFLSWYLAGKITVFDRRGHVAKLCVVLLPLLVAALIAISRVDDYWHHWQDVCTGGFLGTCSATASYVNGV